MVFRGAGGTRDNINIHDVYIIRLASTGVPEIVLSEGGGG